MPCQLTVSKVLRRSLTISALAAALGAVACTRSSSSVAEITGRQPVTLKLSFLYAVGFGGFVAFSVYLPSYLKTAFDLLYAEGRAGSPKTLPTVSKHTAGWACMSSAT